MLFISTNSSLKFQIRKRLQFKKRDKSDKGETDKKILLLIKKINSEKDYYTTSSCAGRIVLIMDSEKKQKGLFLLRTHEKISVAELKKALSKAVKKHKGLTYFKQEPCILHVACSSLEKAKEFLDKAKLAGWKKSGIIASKKRIICEMASTEHIELPIADKCRIFLSDSYLKILVSEANKKLARTWQKIRKLEKLV